MGRIANLPENHFYLRDPCHIKKPPFVNTKKKSEVKIETSKTGTRRESNKWKNLTLSICYIFHPAAILVMVMTTLIAWNIHHVVLTFSNNGTLVRSINKTDALEQFDHRNATSALKNVQEKEIDVHANLHTRAKRSTHSDDGKKKDDDDDEEVKVEKIKRRIPLTSLDDMLLDAEMPVSPGICLPEKNVKLLENQEKKARRTRATLSEHLEKCTSTDDCIQISPFHWKSEGAEDVCRKRTFLSCNVTSEQCICQDRFDLRWDTEMAQSTYQWNPITKTCYVRASNPCKMEIPCAPGTTCRATVSISYNVPPLERICDCSDINLLVKGVNDDWWYCADYWQRTWLFDLDNIKKWDHPAYHIYARMKAKENQNATETEADYFRR